MKKTYSAKSQEPASDEMLQEYHFDYRKARPNRFVERIYKDRRVVVLDPDISEIFTSSESVNDVLRALITTMPKSGISRDFPKQPSSSSKDSTGEAK
jgi:hypothetical protein